MKLLLDTHILLWASLRSPRLPQAAAGMIEDEVNLLHFSAVSIWEIAIKAGLRRPDFVLDPQTFRRNLLDEGFVELPITGAHAAAVVRLPLLHKDPFDRMLLAQATVEGLTLLTVDADLKRYPGPVRAA